MARLTGRAWSGLRRLAQITLVAPAHDGRLEPRHWPPALRATALALIPVLLASLVFIVASDELRASGLPLNVATGYLAPSALPLLSAGMFLAMTLLQTAALHVTWPLRVLALVAMLGICVDDLALASSRVVGWGGPAAFIGLLVFHAVRGGRRFAGFELPVVGLLVFLAGPLVLFGEERLIALGFDTRGLVLASQLQQLIAIAAPVLLAAGAALISVAITAGESVPAALSAARARPSVMILLLLGLLAWNGYQVWQLLAGISTSALAPRIVGGALTLLLTVALAWPALRRANRAARWQAPEAGELAERYGSLVFLLAVGSTSWVLVPDLFMSVGEALRRWQLDVPQFVEVAAHLPSAPLAPSLTAATTAVALLLLAWSGTRRGQWAPSLLAAAFLAPQLVVTLEIAAQDSLPLTYSPHAVRALLFGLLVCVVVTLAATGQLAGMRLLAVLAAAGVLAVRDLGPLIAEPLEALLGFSAVASLVVGLVWRVITDGEFTRGDSRGFPRPTRVLLYLASIMFAATALVFGSLTRDPSGYFDLSAWEQTGELGFADPLFHSAALVWLAAAMLGPRLTATRPVPGSAPPVMR